MILAFVVMPGVTALLKAGAKVVVLTILGAQRKLVPSLTVRPVAQCMAGLLGQPVQLRVM